MPVQEIDLGKVVGSDGKSAYQSAVEAGYTGTEAEFYAALATLQNAPFLPLSGGTVTGELESNTLRVQNIRIPTDYGRDIYSSLSSGTDLSVRFPGYSTRYYYGYLTFFPLDSSTNPNNGMVQVYGIADPEHDNDAANKKYVDDLVGNIGDLLDEINGEVV